MAWRAIPRRRRQRSRSRRRRPARRADGLAESSSSERTGKVRTGCSLADGGRRQDVQRARNTAITMLRLTVGIGNADEDPSSDRGHLRQPSGSAFRSGRHVAAARVGLAATGTPRTVAETSGWAGASSFAGRIQRSGTTSPPRAPSDPWPSVKTVDVAPVDSVTAERQWTPTATDETIVGIPERGS